ncbi:MAG: helix-turn-helix domain-containing protein [Nocardioidaceae bacterium]
MAGNEVDELTLRVSGEVRAWMARRGVRQQELADRLGITQPSLSMRLRGRTRWTINDLVIVAETLNVPVSTLLTSPEEGLGGPDTRE